MRCYKIGMEGSKGWLYAGTTSEDIKRGLDQVVYLHDLDLGEVLTIEVADMTPEAVKALPEFDGFM